jgi:hypothetical protein
METTIGIEDLTMQEIAKAEELSGKPITYLTDDDKPKALITAAVAFVIKRRTDPTFTWNEAVGMSMDQAMAAMGMTAPEEGQTEENPTPPRKRTTAK